MCLVILPCFNEEASLPKVIGALKRVSSSNPEINYVVIDDGSRDRTAEILHDLAPENFVTHSVNIGVSGVLLTGFKIAKRLGAQFVVQCDSDGQHPIDEIPKLLKQAIQDRTDCLIGGRFLKTNGTPHNSLQSTTPVRRLGGMTIAFLLRIFAPTGASVSDPTSGFRVYSIKAASLLMNDIPDEYPEPESLAIMAMHGLKIQETPIVMAARSGGVSSLSGTKGIIYMVKVVSAIIGSKLRRLSSTR